MRDLIWSPIEKNTARKAYQQAHENEYQEIIREVQSRAAALKKPSDIWNLEAWLTDRREEMNQKYDYRYSVLPLVFARLMQEKRITEADLRGLAQEKIELILNAVSVLGRD